MRCIGGISLRQGDGSEGLDFNNIEFGSGRGQKLSYTQINSSLKSLALFLEPVFLPLLQLFEPRFLRTDGVGRKNRDLLVLCIT